MAPESGTWPAGPRQSTLSHPSGERAALPWPRGPQSWSRAVGWVFTGTLGPARSRHCGSAHVFCQAGASVPRTRPAPMSIASWAAAVPHAGCRVAPGGSVRMPLWRPGGRRGPEDISAPPPPHSWASRGLASGGRGGEVCGQPHSPQPSCSGVGGLLGRPMVPWPLVYREETAGSEGPKLLPAPATLQEGSGSAALSTGREGSVVGGDGCP